MWSTDNWAPEEDEMQLEILDLDINGEQKIPTGTYQNTSYIM